MATLNFNANDPLNKAAEDEFHGLSDLQKFGVGKFSSLLNRKIVTRDDVIKHEEALDAQKAAEALAATQTPEGRKAAREARQQAQAASLVETEAKRTAWKKAVADRAIAVAQWDAYVKTLHDVYTAARKGL